MHNCLPSSHHSNTHLNIYSLVYVVLIILCCLNTNNSFIYYYILKVYPIVLFESTSDQMYACPHICLKTRKR